jgi:hypothetical protein
MTQAPRIIDNRPITRAKFSTIKQRQWLPIYAFSAFYIVVLLLSNPFALPIAAIITISIALREATGSRGPWHPITLIAIALCAIPFFFSMHTEPSHAVLLSRVQTYITNSLRSGSVGAGVADAGITQMIDLIFAIARLGFIAFVLFAGWRGYQDFQQSEEMSGMVRLAIFTLATIFTIDLITTLIIPTTTTTTP